MQYFYIKQGSTLNTLRVELVKDGRYDFMKASHFDNALQNADITFTMTDENGNLKISNAECVLAKAEAGSCDEHYVVEYHWIQKIKEPFMAPLKFILMETLQRKERIMNREISFCLFMSRWLS